MTASRLLLVVVCAVVWFCTSPSASADERKRPFFLYRDGLAPRDKWGKLYQAPVVKPTDAYPRYSVRFHYYFKGARTLEADPAYVGAVQDALRRLGYYCGETDGVYSLEVADAVSRLQKHYGMKVTGRLNAGVRRALYLP
jgi:hypothetical protein